MLDWQSEDETIWEDEPSGNPNPRRIRLILIITIIISAIALMVWLADRQVDEAIEELDTTLEEDVLASHELAVTSAENLDSEVFLTLLSGRDPHWTEGQRLLLEEELLFRSGRVLGLTPTDTPPQVISLTLNTTTTEAILLIEQTYTDDQDVPITLHQTLVYRQSENGWLLSPPDARFWGITQYAGGGMLTLVYPEREAELAKRLAEDLETQFAEACWTFLQTRCQSFSMQLRFQQNTNEVRNLAEGHYNQDQTTLMLPSPTLIGWPADEASYQAMLRGYANHIFSGIFWPNSGLDCCDDNAFAEALQRKIQSRLDLQPWPVDATAYYDTLANLRLADDMALFWSRNDLTQAEQNQLYLFVDFLLDNVVIEWGVTTENPERGQVLTRLNAVQNNPITRGRSLGSDPLTPAFDPLAALQTSLTTAQDFDEWIAPYVTENQLFMPGWTLDSGWQVYLMNVSEQVQTGTSASEVTGKLWATCSIGSSYGLYVYDFERSSWTSLFARANYWLSLHQNGDYTVLHRPLEEQEASELMIFENNVLVGSSPIDFPFKTFTINRLSPTGRWLQGLAPNSGGEWNVVRLIDVWSCDPAGCDYTDVPFAPHWSPAGGYAIMHDSNLTSPILVDAELKNPTLLSEKSGFNSIFWLDETTYGYVIDNTIYLGNITGGEPQPILAKGEIQSLIPDAPDNFEMGAVYSALGESNTLLFSAGISGVNAFIFRYTFSWDAPNQGELIRLETGHPTNYLVSHLSPDGRWVSVLPFDERNLPLPTQFLDWQNGTTLNTANGGTSSVQGRWSPDSKWIVMHMDGYFFVQSPHHMVHDRAYHKLIFYPYDTCEQIIWP